MALSVEARPSQPSGAEKLLKTVAKIIIPDFVFDFMSPIYFPPYIQKTRTLGNMIQAVGMTAAYFTGLGIPTAAIYGAGKLVHYMAEQINAPKLQSQKIG